MTYVKRSEMKAFDGDIEGFQGWEEGPYWLRVMGRLKRMVETQTEGLKGKTFLEVGCGRSQYIPIAVNRGMETVGLDISIEFLKLNRGQRVLGDGENLPFRDGAIDFLLCVGVVHHVPDKAKMVRELRRVCRGRMLIIEPYSRSLNLLYWAARKLLMAVLPWGFIIKLSGFIAPHESFVSKRLMLENLDGFNIEYSFWSPFREPPLKAFRKYDFGRLNDLLERTPLVRSFGTYIVMSLSRR